MTGYWVYTITTPDGMVYVGYSGRKDTKFRWKKSAYKRISLWPYIEKFGWENMRFFFIDGLKTEQEAIKFEGELILMYDKMGKRINKMRSGGVWSIQGKRKYDNDWYQDNTEKARERSRRHYHNNLEKERERCRDYYARRKNSRPDENKRREMREIAKRYKEKMKILNA